MNTQLAAWDPDEPRWLERFSMEGREAASIRRSVRLTALRDQGKAAVTAVRMECVAGVHHHRRGLAAGDPELDAELYPLQAALRNDYVARSLGIR